MPDHSPYFQCLREAFRRVERALEIFPDDYLGQLPVAKMARLLDEDRSAEGPTPLFFSVGSILPFILQEEKTVLDEKALLDYTSMLLLIYCNYSLFDGILDKKQGAFLPASLVVFREALLLGKELGIEMSEPLNTVETYNVCPNSIPIGKIIIKRARGLDEQWHRIQDGFAIAPVIIDHFVASHIGKTRRDWACFFNEYLVYRQLLDDSNDFVEDYRNRELRSLGIFALMKCFPDREKVNLKNPLTAFRFQLYVLRKLKILYEGLMDRFFEQLVQQGMTKQEFLDSVKLLEKLL